MLEGVKALYLEIAEFWHSFDGTYSNIDSATYRELIDALLDGRYRIARNESGELISATTWWMIGGDDIDLVRRGGRPDDVSSGTIVYVADHCGYNGLADLVRFIRQEICIKGVCWHHKYKTPERFKYFPDKEGHNA